MRKHTKIHQMVSCDGKRRFTSYSEAQRFLKGHKRPNKKKIHKALGIYKCEYRSDGHHFHIGGSKLN